MKNITIIWLLLLTCLLYGCDLDGPQRECDYNARLLFHYSNGGGTNRITDYVATITDYLFDEQGRLLDVSTRTGAGVLQRTLSLPPGKYTMVSWGNLADKNLVHPGVDPGTALQDMHLVKNNPHASATRCATARLPWQQNTERLHFGRTEFTVRPVGAAQQTVFMGHAYLDLFVTVAGVAGEEGEAFSLRLDGTHPVYRMEHYRQINAQGYPMYIPRPDDTQENTHLLPGVRMNSGGAMEGEFVSYRLTGSSRPVFSVWQGDRQVVRDVDLKHFFDTMLIDMDTNECQEFHIRVTVDGDNVYVQFVSLGDWIDGGSIGG